MNSESNRQELAKACGTYLLATRIASVREIKDIVRSQPGRYRESSDNFQAKEVPLEITTPHQSALRLALRRGADSGRKLENSCLRESPQ